ncbi:hypothetical protein MUK42_17636 [Musa troglodytarum]|uniref:Uncharacterized protein n=1 Tax=Musa troglodytarum TaxID=320322 RepID=A0A9E7GZQ0_9LILI|nr:hypothetical protein MUK42_17636 [Musa troglodytarum]URE22094.1 hypothetical protein MUK42_17636 [Musa troglodytarum]
MRSKNNLQNGGNCNYVVVSFRFLRCGVVFLVRLRLSLRPPPPLANTSARGRILLPLIPSYLPRREEGRTAKKKKPYHRHLCQTPSHGNGHSGTARFRCDCDLRLLVTDPLER